MDISVVSLSPVSIDYRATKILLLAYLFSLGFGYLTLLLRIIPSYFAGVFLSTKATKAEKGDFFF